MAPELTHDERPWRHASELRLRQQTHGVAGLRSSACRDAARPTRSELTVGGGDSTWRCLGTPVALVLVWQWMAVTAVLDERYWPAPSAVWSAGVELADSGELWEATWASWRRALIGFTSGCTCGVAAGVALGMVRTLRVALEPVLYAFWTVPKLALLPLLLLIFGLGEGPLIASSRSQRSSSCSYPRSRQWRRSRPRTASRLCPSKRRAPAAPPRAFPGGPAADLHRAATFRRSFGPRPRRRRVRAGGQASVSSSGARGRCSSPTGCTSASSSFPSVERSSPWRSRCWASDSSRGWKSTSGSSIHGPTDEQISRR